MMEVLPPEGYWELDRFVAGHPQGAFTQISPWARVKDNWRFRAVVSRDEVGRIRGSVAVLIQYVPGLKCSLLYAPRGPVCDPGDKAALLDLKAGVDVLAREHKAYAFRCDPDVLMDRTDFAQVMRDMGFTQSYGPDGFEGVQARFNYRLYLQDRTPEELFANLSQTCRRKVRIAQKNGVTIKVVDESRLPDFQRMMEITGKRDGFSIRPEGYFAKVLRALGQHVRLYMGFYEDTPVCGAITTNFGGKCCYVYGASTNEHRQLMPNYLMQWEMILWAVETGCFLYDFQGISGDLSPEGRMGGLYQFKKGFRGQVDELAGEFVYVYRPLLDRLVNAALTGREKLSHLRRKGRT